jgi:hypothetical protein
VRKKETPDVHEYDKNTAETALRGMFPSAASFLNFKNQDPEISRAAIPAIVHFAATYAVIEKETEKELIDFLEDQSRKPFRRAIPKDVMFSDVIDELAENVSIRNLITHLNKIAETLTLPSVSTAMITRMKQHFQPHTPRKRALLRLLAFWIAKNRPQTDWNYENLLNLQAKASRTPRPFQEKAGITINFYLHGQGDMILPPDIQWLKRELADSLDTLDLNGQMPPRKIEPIGTTSFSIHLSKQPGPLDEPLLYQKEIRFALAMAHQMSVRWLLCPYSSPQKRLIIMVQAGPLTQDRHQPLTWPQHVPINDSGIYLDNFAHLCAEIAHIKGFRRLNTEGHLHDKSIRGFWSLVYFWPNHFYDYIPCLLEEKMLPKCSSGRAYKDFQRALFCPDSTSQTAFGTIDAIHRHPHHTLHLVEIAKVLHARQMHQESEEIISRILLVEPDNLPARYMRLLAYGHLANRERDLEASRWSFECGIAHGEYILRTFPPDTEILWALGILHFNRAIKWVHRLRRSRGTPRESIRRKNVAEHLMASVDHFRRGLATSSAGRSDSCLFWLLYAQSFLELFSRKDRNILQGRISLEDDNNIFRQAGIRSLRILGLLPQGDPQDPDVVKDDEAQAVSLQAAALIRDRNHNTRMGRSYIPYAQYISAIVLWDFTPRLTKPVCNLVLNLLNEARANAEKLLQDNVSVYHVFLGFMFADRFVRHIDHAIKIVKTFSSEGDPAVNGGSFGHPGRDQTMRRTKLMLQEIARL